MAAHALTILRQCAARPDDRVLGNMRHGLEAPGMTVGFDTWRRLDAVVEEADVPTLRRFIAEAIAEVSWMDGFPTYESVQAAVLTGMPFQPTGEEAVLYRRLISLTDQYNAWPLDRRSPDINGYSQ